MPKRTRRVAAVAALGFVLVGVPGRASAQPEPPVSYDPVTMTTANVGTELAIARYATAVNDEAFAELVEHNLLVEWVAAHQPPPAPTPAHTSTRTVAAPASGGTTVGSCTGFSIPAYIIQRESGGDPNARNPSSGAYGCAQTLPSHYSAGGTCAGLDMYSIDGQRSCVDRLSNGGTNLAPWALTR